MEKGQIIFQGKQYDFDKDADHPTLLHLFKGRSWVGSLTIDNNKFSPNVKAEQELWFTVEETDYQILATTNSQS